MENKKTILRQMTELLPHGCFGPLFFTLSKNILHTYTLPITMPIMFLLGILVEDFTEKASFVSYDFSNNCFWYSATGV
jgi:hypothetical protein